MPLRSDFDLDQANAQLAGKPAEDLFRWAIDTFGANRVAVQASMQKTSGVLMHLAHRFAPTVDILFVDTGVHFPETLALRDEFASRYGLTIRSVAAHRTFDQQYEDFGRYLHETDDRPAGSPPGYQECCRLRKEEPYVEAAKGRYDAIISGLTRAEGGARKNVLPVLEDPRVEAYKVHPLIDWTEEDVDLYTEQHGLPIHALYAERFTSIGCWTCTTPTAKDEHPRAGRWRHLNHDGGKSPMYCGINLVDKS